MPFDCRSGVVIARGPLRAHLVLSHEIQREADNDLLFACRRSGGKDWSARSRVDPGKQSDAFCSIDFTRSSENPTTRGAGLSPSRCGPLRKRALSVLLIIAALDVGRSDVLL